MKIILHWFLRAFAIMLAAYLLPGIWVSGFGTALVVALVLGFLNTFIKPILVIISFPLQLLTLGLFTFVINGLLILAVHNLVKGFFVENFWWAIVLSFFLAILNSFFHHFEKRKED